MERCSCLRMACVKRQAQQRCSWPARVGFSPGSWIAFLHRLLCYATNFKFGGQIIVSIILFITAQKLQIYGTKVKLMDG